jgi:hypothetical protein
MYPVYGDVSHTFNAMNTEKVKGDKIPLFD